MQESHTTTKRKMKKIIIIAISVLWIVACAERKSANTLSAESASVTWIADKPSPTLQPRQLYADVPDSLWNALHLQEGVPSSMNCVLLRCGGKTILIDAGLGAPFSQLLPKLKEEGITPEALSLIYITHMHPDHIGGLLKDGKPTFPNADIYINQVEAEAWKAMPGDAGKLPNAVLAAYNSHLHLFEAGDTLPGGVQSFAAYGHTPGHTVFQVDSILVIGDLIHGAALQLEHPEYGPSYDMDAEAARQSRIRILNYARQNHLTMWGMHLPAPGYVK